MIKQCKHCTKYYDPMIQDWLVVRCQRVLGHDGKHAAVTPSTSCVLTRWNY